MANYQGIFNNDSYMYGYSISNSIPSSIPSVYNETPSQKQFYDQENKKLIERKLAEQKFLEEQRLLEEEMLENLKILEQQKSKYVDMFDLL